MGGCEAWLSLKLLRGRNCSRSCAPETSRLRARHVEIDALPKRAITGCFRIEHVQSFLKVNQEFSLGIMGTRIYKYSFTGHRVAEMDANEL